MVVKYQSQSKVVMVMLIFNSWGVCTSNLEGSLVKCVPKVEEILRLTQLAS